MEIVYYRTAGGRTPVKEYLSRYDLSKSDQKKKFLKVDAVIRFTAQQGGIARGEYSAPLINYDFHEMRIKEGDSLVRVLYFAFNRKQLVLLHAFDKPDYYEKGRKKKLNSRKINPTMEEARSFYEDFRKNPDNFEEYEPE